MLATILHPHQALYKSDIHLAEKGCQNGWVASTTKLIAKFHLIWLSYVKTLGISAHLEKATTSFATKCWVVSGSAARVRTGAFGRGCQVAAGTCSAVLTAIGQTILLETEVDPIKSEVTHTLLYPIGVMFDGWRKVDPSTMKKLPIEVDIPEHLISKAYAGKSSHQLATVYLTLIAFYCLLRVSEYTCKRTRNELEHTVQFWLMDVIFFKQDKSNQLCQVQWDASA